MSSIGIITIHKINNYGSVFQAYALQRVCEELGFQVEIIDYDFPNIYHKKHRIQVEGDLQPNEPIFIKMLYAFALKRQHKGICKFVSKYQRLSPFAYHSPDELNASPPLYDVYITGSDQLWNPRHCGGDPAFLLHFAPDSARKISYAASICSDKLPVELVASYQQLLGRYSHISVRENKGVELIENLIGAKAEVVLDPTLLITSQQWNILAERKRIIKKKYILCYFLNYTFNAFPYVDELAKYIQQCTGFEIVRVARPPHSLNFSHTIYQVGASPEEFLALVRDAEIVLTTSFHGTAFAVNFGKPVFTIVKDKASSDNRQVSLMHNLGLDKQVLAVNDPMPDWNMCKYDCNVEQERLNELRHNSMDYLKRALSYE